MGEVRLCRPCQHKQQKIRADWGKEERRGCSRRNLGSCLANTPINPSQYSLVCLAPSELFGPGRKILQLDTCPAKDICPTIKSPRSSPDSCKASSCRQFQSWHKFQFGEEPSSEEASGVHPDSDVIQGFFAILNRQPIGSGDPRKNLLVSFPEVVQPRRDLCISRRYSGAFDRAVHGPQV